MANIDKKEGIKNLQEEIKKLENKDFNLYFFVMDTKGNPSGELTYIYQTAYNLSEMGYRVTMLHQEEKFVGVGEWLGEKYAALPHKNIEKENVDVSPADILLIPEIYANVMSQTKSLPCKKVAILHNQAYLTSTIPVGVTWADMHIYDVVTTTRENEKVINDYFPFVKSWVVSPAIPNVFRKPQEPQKLIVNVISKNQTDIDKIVKPFYWKYPMYKWVSFRDVRGLPQDSLADVLREGAITIWIDDETNFGYTLLEAMRSGSLTLAKVPNDFADWMISEDGNLINGPIWFSNIKDLVARLASVVRTWTVDGIPHEVYEEADKLSGLYTNEQQRQEIEQVYVNGLFTKHKEEIKNAISIMEKEENKDKKNA